MDQETNDKGSNLTIWKIIKLELQLLFFLVLFLVIALFLIADNLSELKEVLPAFLYATPLLFLIFLIGGFISYRKRNDKYFPEKILTLQNPLMVIILDSFGIKFDPLKPKVFYFYYNLLFGISLILCSLILLFAFGNYRINYIPLVFGIIIIISGIIKKRKY